MYYLFTEREAIVTKQHW